MNGWYAASTLVGLPGMPEKAARAVRTRGERHGWEHRIRAGRVEYRETSLPPETREALADLRAARPLELPECPQPDPRAAAVADARLEVLAVLDRWLAAENPRRLIDALHTFAGRYTAGHVEVSGETRTLVPRISRASLCRWRRAREEAGGRGLMSRQGVRPGAALDAGCATTDAVGAFILEYPHGKAPMLRRWLIARYGLDPSTHVATVRRWMARWRAEHPNLLMEATDPDRYRSHRKPAFGAAAAGVERINQLWELDSTPADVLCTDGRHHLVGVIDVCSRRARALVVPTSNAMGIAALMRRALLDWGVPETVRTDEGKDYVSRHVRRALADLAIEHDILPPYSPELKPFIERWFGTLTRGCLAYLPGFAGHNVAERQAIRDRKSFAARRGEGDADAFAVSLTAAELQARIDAWIEHVYEREPHGGLDGRSPFEAAAGQPVRSIENERALDILLAPPPSGRPERVVGNQVVVSQII